MCAKLLLASELMCAKLLTASERHVCEAPDSVAAAYTHTVE